MSLEHQKQLADLDIKRQRARKLKADADAAEGVLLSRKVAESMMVEALVVLRRRIEAIPSTLMAGGMTAEDADKVSNEIAHAFKGAAAELVISSDKLATELEQEDAQGGDAQSDDDDEEW